MKESDSNLEKAQLRRGRAMVIAAALLWSTSGAFVKSPPLAAIPQDAARSAVGLLPGPFCRGCAGSVRAAKAHPLATDAGSVRHLLCVDEFALRHRHDAHDRGRRRLFAVHGDRMGLSGKRAFLGERIGRRNLVALACAMVGIWWIVAGDWTTQNFGGNWLALASGAGYGGVIVSLKLLRDEDSAWLVALCHGTAGLILLPSVLTGPLSSVRCSGP